MTIKELLKEYGITLGTFSKKLLISRPTLDAYIKLFEQNETIPQEKYDLIFNILFAKEITKDEFFKQYNRISVLLMRDKSFGVLGLEPDATDMLTDLIQLVKDDLSTHNWNPSIYAFINMIICNYHKEPIFETLAEYFSLLNGYEDVSNINIDKIHYYANYYNLFKRLASDIEHTSYNQCDFDAFIKRCREISEKDLLQTKVIKERIDSKVQDALIRLQSKGYSLSDLSDEKILNEIIKNKKE